MGVWEGEVKKDEEEVKEKEKGEVGVCVALFR